MLACSAGRSGRHSTAMPPTLRAVAPGTPLFDALAGSRLGPELGVYCRSALADCRTCDGTCASSSKRQLPDGRVVLFRFTTRGCGGPICRPANPPSCSVGSPASMNTAPRRPSGQRHDRLPARQWRAFGNRTLNADAFRFGASACCRGACTGHGALFGSFEIAAGSPLTRP